MQDDEAKGPDFRHIKVVCFDGVDTLLRVRGSVGEVYARVARSFGVNPDPAALQRAFAAVFAQAPPPAFPGVPAADIAAWEKRYWRQIVRAVFDTVAPIPQFDAYFESVYDAFRRAEAWELFPDTLPVLAHLRKVGVGIGIISNFDSRIYEVFDALGLRTYVDAFFISTEIGAAKPERAIFQAALDYFACSAAHTLFVGDSPREDIAGATAAGITPVLIDRGRQHAQITGLLRIADLYALRDWIP